MAIRFVRGPIAAGIALALLIAAPLGLSSQAAEIAAVQPAPAARQELAPTGVLRVGVYPGAPTSLVRDVRTGEARGVTVELGAELARRLGVPVQLVEFERVAQVVDALKDGKVDFTVTNATAARAEVIDYSDPVLEIELGYLALRTSRVAALADVDRAGVRIGVTEGSSTQGVLTRQFKNAVVVTAPSLEAAAAMITARQVEAYATNKSILFELADRVPDSRVLDGYWGLEHMAIAIPKGRPAGLAYVRGFAEAAKGRGLVAQAVERAGLRGSRAP